MKKGIMFLSVVVALVAVSIVRVVPTPGATIINVQHNTASVNRHSMAKFIEGAKAIEELTNLRMK